VNDDTILPSAVSRHNERLRADRNREVPYGQNPFGRNCVLVDIAGAPNTPATLPSHPPGGTSQAVGNAIVLSSPANNLASRVLPTLLPPGHPRRKVKSWFWDQALVLAGPLGPKLRPMSMNKMDSSFVWSRLRAQTGVAEEDPRLQVANQYSQQLATSKFELAVASTPAAPGPPQGQFGP
jgi:hypothetical protein